MQTWGEKGIDGQVDAVRARFVLRDAYLSSHQFRENLESGEIHRVRRDWVATLALLRAVGHVLQKVDGGRSEWISGAVQAEYEKIKRDRYQNLIFWELIEAERNSALKNYETAIIEVSSHDGRRFPEVRPVLLGDVIYQPQAALSSALKWWEDHLRNVENSARHARSDARHLRKSGRRIREL